VISSSFGDGQSAAPGSVFYEAYWQLYVDAALRLAPTTRRPGLWPLRADDAQQH